MPHSPRSSTSSDSFRSDHSPANDYDPSAALIVVHDVDDPDPDPISFEFTSDDDGDEEDEQLDSLHSPSVPSLPATSVFLYLLTPFLKLGAIQIIDASREVQLQWAVSALLVFAVLSALTRQVWYMLAKYVRRADMETVLLETFARGRGRDRLRNVIRQVVRFSIGLFRVLLTVVYLRGTSVFFSGYTKRFEFLLRSLCRCSSPFVPRDSSSTYPHTPDNCPRIERSTVVLPKLPGWCNCIIYQLDFCRHICSLAHRHGICSC